ncbi:MAG: 3-hydroxyacyl-CoA dehydrogenase/enoyl-CoA hydratase/3-hydroxybutyryl-CoA epimerase [Lentimonas sp.]|jgi:3-hydroxyacyl-CoA dehydrogenase/enoyl-CoA hydratase/3-hydroxybutyryl-CoA epimerase
MKHLKLQIDNGDATLIFDREGSRANIFDDDALDELIEALNTIKTNVSIISLQIESAKPTIFVAGADIKSLAYATPGELAALIDLGHEAFSLLESLSIPTIALIHGACLGGGFELALACDWRIASDAKCTSIGLPETQLGILPAWGGSTRLPRLIGLTDALPLVLAGKALNARAAKRKGLIDDIVHQSHLQDFAQQYLARGKRDPEHHTLQHNSAAARLIEATARKDLMKRTRGLYPAPIKAMEVMCHAVYHPQETGFRKERNAIIELVSQPETARLIDLFLLREKAKKLKIENVAPTELTHPVVFGSGIMGSGIAYWLSTRGYPVLMQDINEAALARGITAIDQQYESAVKHYILSKADARTSLDRIHASVEKLPLHNRDVVIEAAVEDLDIKKQIFADLSSRCSDTCILATNTSALPIHELAQVVRNPERLVGLHFFNPVARMPLVEVVQAPSTSHDTLASAIRFVQKIGKLPVVVQDSPGFLVNRILVPYLLEACKRFSEGIDPVSIDEAMLDFGMPMGPLRLLDEIGLDIGKHVAATLTAAFPDRMSLLPMMDAMIKEGFLGRKSGKGFYLYDGTTPEPNPLALALRESKEGAAENLAADLAALMSEEAARCLDEGIADTPQDIDFAMVMGTGYAPFRGGPLRYSDDHHLFSPGFYQNHPHHRMVS